MLTVETHKQLGDPRKFEATRVLVRDEHKNPIALIVQNGRMIHIKRVGDPDFNQFLQTYGINRTVVVETMNVKPEILI